MILRNPRALAMILAAFPARLAYGMVGLDLYFKVHDATHSIALAGLAAGANGIVGSLSTGMRAAVIDRLGLKIPLRIFVPAYAVALASFDACHGAKLLIGFAALLGFTSICRCGQCGRPQYPRSNTEPQLRLTPPP